MSKYVKWLRGQEYMKIYREQSDGPRRHEQLDEQLDEHPNRLRTHQYLTLNLDTDNYLFSFLNIKDLLIVAQLNKLINKLVRTINIVKQFLEFRTYEEHHCLINFACANNYIELLDQLYILSNKFKYTFDTIIWIIKKGHIRILEWFLEKNLNLKFVDCNVLVMYCLIFYRSNILNRLIECNIVNKQNIIINEKTITYQYMIQNIIHVQTVHIKYELKMACASGIIEVLDILNKDKNLEEYFEDKNLRFGENKLNLVRIIMMNDHYRALKWVCVNYRNCVKNNIDKYILFLIQHNKYNMVKWFVQYELVTKIKNIKNLMKIAQDKRCTKIIDLLMRKIKNC